MSACVHASRSTVSLPARRCAAALVVGFTLGASVHADEAAQPVDATGAPAAEPSVRPAVADSLYARTVLPRQDVGAGFAAPRLTPLRSRIAPSEAPIGPDGRPATELAGVSYRWWATRGRTDLGVGVGTVGRLIAPTPGLTDASTAIVGSTPTVTVGWRYRLSNDSAVFADASGARGLGLAGNGNYVNTKLGAEWKTSTSRVGFDRGNLGVQLDSGYRMSLRLRKSGVGVYMRSQF